MRYYTIDAENKEEFLKECEKTKSRLTKKIFEKSEIKESIPEDEEDNLGYQKKPKLSFHFNDSEDDSDLGAINNDDDEELLGIQYENDEVNNKKESNEEKGIDILVNFLKSSVVSESKNMDLNGENINLDKKIKELEEENKRLNEEISIIKNSPSPYYLETRIKVIKFYLQKELNQQDVNNFDCKDLFLSEIKNDFGIKFTPQKFSEITLYYINEKLREILSRDSDPQNIFVNPVINRAGKTFEKNMVNENNLRENKLVFDICIILKENKKLEMNNFKQIKKLLLNEEEKFYENPVVNMNGITEEGKPNELYQNLVIKNVIKEIKIFDNEFFENKDIINFNKSRNKDNDIEIINSKAIFFSEK